jgi:hypothetical protein
MAYWASSARCTRSRAAYLVCEHHGPRAARPIRSAKAVRLAVARPMRPFEPRRAPLRRPNRPFGTSHGALHRPIWPIDVRDPGWTDLKGRLAASDRTCDGQIGRSDAGALWTAASDASRAGVIARSRAIERARQRGGGSAIPHARWPATAHDPRSHPARVEDDTYSANRAATETYSCERIRSVGSGADSRCQR